MDTETAPTDQEMIFLSFSNAWSGSQHVLPATGVRCSASLPSSIPLCEGGGRYTGHTLGPAVREKSSARPATALVLLLTVTNFSRPIIRKAATHRFEAAQFCLGICAIAPNMLLADGVIHMSR